MIISIDGNIGSGKSTILDRLSELGYPVVKEGIDNWSVVLEKFYVDKSRWAFTLQVAILQDMHEKYKNALLSDDIVFFERNPASSLLFLQNSYENHYLDDTEYTHYLKLHKLLSWQPDRVFKLNTPPAVCYQRIISRMDPAIETGLTLEYVNMLGEKYAKVQGEDIDGTRDINTIIDTLLKKIKE